jgi:hypothetical protein
MLTTHNAVYMDTGTQVYFKSVDGRILQAMFLKTIILENNAYHQLQLKDGSRITISSTTYLQPIEDGYYQPGSDCQV